MDVNQVPEFFVMLHSTELPEQRTLYRNFFLSLLRDGIRSRQDYLVCARRRVFRILLSLQPSNLLADKADKVKKNICGYCKVSDYSKFVLSYRA